MKCDRAKLGRGMFAQRKMMAARLKRPCVVPELKHLYTAITRARVRVIFYDSRSLTFRACPLSEGGLRVFVPRGAHACGRPFAVLTTHRKCLCAPASVVEVTVFSTCLGSGEMVDD